MPRTNNSYNKAAEMILNAERITAFSGAGISVESGIPPFRGKNGLWSKYNPIFLEIDYFLNNPKKSWELIKEIFYDFFGKAKPNAAHFALAKMESSKWLNSIITQNIDDLHQQAGSKTVYEFHGTSKNLICTKCSQKFPVSEIGLNELPPCCPACNGLLKPDFVFFGEPIPEFAMTNSIRAAETSQVFIVIGTTGEIMPASTIPFTAKENGAKIIEMNIEPSNYTKRISDIFLQGKASQVGKDLLKNIQSISNGS